MFDITCSRSCLAQLTRHRIASYTVQSHRYTEPEFVMCYENEVSELVEAELQRSQNAYGMIRTLGYAKEQARAVVPHCVPVNLTMSINLRSLINLLKLRSSKHAEEEIRYLANCMLGELELAFRDCKELYFNIVNIVKTDEKQELINKLKNCGNCKHFQFTENVRDCTIDGCVKYSKWVME